MTDVECFVISFCHFMSSTVSKSFICLVRNKRDGLREVNTVCQSVLVVFSLSHVPDVRWRLISETLYTYSGQL